MEVQPATEVIEDAGSPAPWQRSGGLVLAWDQPSAPRRGFVAAGFVCPDPDCPCRTVKLQIREAREGLRRVARDRDLLTLDYPEQEPADTRSMRAVLDLESGFLEPAGPDIPDLRERVQAFSDAHLLAEYRALWEQTKGHGPPWREADWSWLEDSTMLPWWGISKSDPDVFPIDGGYYATVEQYCGERSCTCKGFLIEVLYLDRDPRKNPKRPPPTHLIGTFRIDFDDRRAMDFQAERDVPKGHVPRERCGERALRKVASAYLATHPRLERARRRHARIREIGPAILDLSLNQQFGPRIEPVRNAPKVAPNDRCPCGSGRKYKRCCGMQG